MKILFSGRYLPQNTTQQELQKTVTTPSFKASKAQVAESLGKEIAKNLGLSGNKLKQILADPTKSKEFFGVLGATISATVLSLFNLIDEEADVADNTVAVPELIKDDKKDNVVNESKPKEEKIEFKVKRGAPFREEKEFINFVETNFGKQKRISEKLILLFNKIGGINRDGAHVLNDRTISNRELLAVVTEELKNNVQDVEKIKEIINKYDSLQAIEGYKIEVVKPKEKKPKIKVKFSKSIEDTFKVRQPLAKKAYEIVEASSTQEEADKKVKQITTLLTPDREYNNDIVIKQALTNIGKTYLEYLGELARIVDILPEQERCDFYKLLADKTLNEDTLKTWNLNIQNRGLPFSIYNELKRLNIDDETIKNITKMKVYSRINDLKIKDIEENSFILRMPASNSLNSNFSNIKILFENLTGKEVNLPAKSKEKLTKEDILKELEEDFDRNGKTTYENIVKYLYWNNHEVNHKGDFYKRQSENRFDYLAEILNNTRVFNPNFFSTHSKLRFIERFVVNENFGKIRLNKAVANKTRDLIDDIGNALTSGVEAKPYFAGDIMGVQLIIPTKNGDVIKITLDNENKIHTII